MAGNASRKSGSEAEQTILAAANLAYGDQLQLYHLPVEKSRGSGGRMIYRRTSPFDFFGSWCGVALAVECKRSAQVARSIRIIEDPTDKSFGVKLHQHRALVDWWMSGGVAMLVWSNGEHWFRLQGEALAEARDRVQLADFEPIPDRGGLPAFLDGITVTPLSVSEGVADV